MKEGIGVKTNVKIRVRKFHPDPQGTEKGAHDGQSGFYGDWQEFQAHNILTNAGRDFLHLQGYETTGLGTNGGNYIALSSNTSAPADGDTSLAGEITNGGLARAQGTVSHNAGENTSTIVKTFTASDTHTAVQKSGLFTANTGGTLVNENTFTSVNLENNDQLQVTWTLTIDD